MKRQGENETRIKIDSSFFNEAYIPYLGRDERYQVFYGGSGSGKSRFVAQNLILEMLKQKITLLVVMETYTGMEQKVYKELLETAADMQIGHMLKTKTNPLKINIPVTGSEVIFIGADDESKLLSLSGIDYCWVEEADNISYDYWTQLKLRLRGRGVKKKFFISFNPTSVNSWLKKEFFDNPHDDSFICHTTYKDNRFLDDEYIKSVEELKERNPHRYEIYALGKWGVLGKTVYDNWTAEEFDTNQIIKDTPNIQAAYGLDFGFKTDPSTLLCTLVDLDNRKLYIFDELYEKGLLNNELAQRIIEEGYAKERIIADSAEQKSIEELRQYGIPRIQAAKKGQGSINAGIGFIQQFKIIVHPSCKHTIQELENYSYKKDKATGQYLNKPIDSFNHCLDSLRYALEPYQSGKSNKLVFLPKSAFGIY